MNVALTLQYLPLLHFCIGYASCKNSFRAFYGQEENTMWLHAKAAPQISSTTYSMPCSLYPTHPYWTCSFRKNSVGSVPLPLGLPLFTDLTEEVGLETSGTGKCDFASAAVELSVFSRRYTPKEVQEGRSGSYVQTGLFWSGVGCSGHSSAGGLLKWADIAPPAQTYPAPPPKPESPGAT